MGSVGACPALDGGNGLMTATSNKINFQTQTRAISGPIDKPLTSLIYNFNEEVEGQRTGTLDKINTLVHNMSRVIGQVCGAKSLVQW